MLFVEIYIFVVYDMLEKVLECSLYIEVCGFVCYVFVIWMIEYFVFIFWLILKKRLL